MKSERTVDAQCRKLWSKKHGHDTYGSDDSDVREVVFLWMTEHRTIMNDIIYYSEDSLSDAESISLNKSVPTPTGDTSWCFEDGIISGICMCGALLTSAQEGLPLKLKKSLRWVHIVSQGLFC